MNITFGGGFIGNEGLTYMGREILKQLKKHHKINIDCGKIEGYWKDYFNNFKKSEEDIYIINGHTPLIPKIAKKHKKIIAITVFETRLPQEWIDSINIPEVKQIWTISEFCKEFIGFSGVKKSIKIIKMGINEGFKKSDINLFGEDNTFKFLNVSAPHAQGVRDRKGLDVLIKAFKKEFGDSDKVTLILKLNSIYADRFHRNRGLNFNMQNYIFSLIPKGYNSKNIALLQGNFTIEQLNNLYNSVDCGVFASRAEGFGLSQLEMASIGKPVITTEYSATNEFSDPRLRCNILGLYPLDYQGFPYYDDTFAEPDVKHLRKLMRTVCGNYKEEKEAAKKHILTLKDYTWDTCGKDMNRFLKQIV